MATKQVRTTLTRVERGEVVFSLAEVLRLLRATDPSLPEDVKLVLAVPEGEGVVLHNKHGDRLEYTHDPRYGPELEFAALRWERTVKTENPAE